MEPEYFEKQVALSGRDKTMPLTPGNSRSAISSNISELTHHGSRPRNHDQIVAIALSNARRHPRAEGGSANDLQPGMADPGNLDLSNRPVVRNPDGRVSTVRSIGVNVDGKEYVIPTISADGRSLSNDRAFDEFRRTGQHMGSFTSPVLADDWANKIHEGQATRYGYANGGASDIAAALRIAHRAAGGFTPPAPPYFERQEDSAVARSRSPYGFTVGQGGGRTDKNAVTLGSGSYVLPSDVVAGLGDGNSLAGAKIWDQILSSMPFGIATPKAAGHRGPPEPPHDAYLAQAITGTTTQPHFAEGGKTEGVPILAADGEILLSPDDVLKVGHFYAPDRERNNHAAMMRRGHRILDNFVKHVRGKTIRHLKSLPGPVGSKDASKGHI